MFPFNFFKKRPKATRTPEVRPPYWVDTPNLQRSPVAVCAQQLRGDAWLCFTFVADPKHWADSPSRIVHNGMYLQRVGAVDFRAPDEMAKEA